MSPLYSRRFVLGAFSLALAGCTGTTGDSDNENSSNQTNETMTDREQMVERLPTPNPLEPPLPGLVAAEDRAAFADDSTLTYRDGAVKVEITLEPDGEPPEEYLPEDRSGYGETVIAFVDVDDLVDLATDDNVRLVSRYRQPETDTETPG